MINMVVLTALMESKGYTFAKLERAADVGNGVIKDWANRNPSLRNLIKVADLLGCSLDDLISRDRRTVR